MPCVLAYWVCRASIISNGKFGPATEPSMMRRQRIAFSISRLAALEGFVCNHKEIGRKLRHAMIAVMPEIESEPLNSKKAAI